MKLRLAPSDAGCDAICDDGWIFERVAARSGDNRRSKRAALRGCGLGSLMSVDPDGDHWTCWPMAWCRAAREGLDDDHAAAAARAAIGGCRGVISIGGICRAAVLPIGCVEQLSCPRNVVGTIGAGQQAIVADAVEAGLHISLIVSGLAARG